MYCSDWVHNATDEFLPGRVRSGMTSPEDPHAWPQPGCHEEDFDFLSEFDIDEEEFDRRSFPASAVVEPPARPEADGYGMMSGEYNIPRPVSIPLPPGVERPSCCCRSPESRAFKPHNPEVMDHLLEDRWYGNKANRPHHKPIFKPVYTLNKTLPTLLPNYTLEVHVAQFRSILPHGYVTKVFVNGQWVVAPDVPARNGAIHVVKRLIHPKGKGRHGKHGGHGHHFEGEEPRVGQYTASDDPELDHEWDDWEEWLPQWANED